MTAEEIKELLRLKNWSDLRLAEELGITQSAVLKWLGGSSPGPTATKFMRQWLAEARRKAGAAQPA
jgi:transcriptional regulator with XRE-family HTH domain